MLLNEARKTIYKKFLAAWEDVETETGEAVLPVVLANEAEEGTASNRGGFVRLSVSHEANRQLGIAATGNRVFVNYGRVYAQIFTPLKKGLQIADKYAQYARNIFHGKNIEGQNLKPIRFHDVTVTEEGEDDGFNYYLIEAPFIYQETK